MTLFINTDRRVLSTPSATISFAVLEHLDHGSGYFRIIEREDGMVTIKTWSTVDDILADPLEVRR